MRYLNQIKRDFENLSMKNKLLAVVLSNVVLILFIALMGLRISSNAYNEQLYKAIAGNLSFSSQTISGNLKSIETLSSVIISSSVIQDSLNRIDSTDDPLIWSDNNPRISAAINNYQQAYKNNGVAAIALNNRHFQNLTNFVVINNADTDTVRDAVDKAREREGAITWTIDYDHGLYILSRSVRKVYNLELDHLGDLLVFVDLDRIVRDANRAVTTYGDSGYILFDGDQLIYTSDGIDPETANGFMKQTGQPYSIVHQNGHSYFAVKNTIPYYNWTYINLVPYDQISNSTGMAYRLILAMLIVGFIAAMTFSRRLTRYILKDFDLLIQKMEFFSSTELKMPEVEVDYSKRTDEISRLHQHFDTMAGRIQYLVRNNYVNQILSRDAKLKALESQINPHFLYNTLDSINWMALMAGNEEVSEMILALGQLFRSNMNTSGIYAKVSNAVENVRLYMYLQQVRFEEGLEYQIEVEDDVKGAMILKNLIQPLVENSIKHGIEPWNIKGSVHISIKKSGDLISLAVQDNGHGIAKEQLDHLRQQWKDIDKEEEEGNTGKGSVGLRNIMRRLWLCYGSKASFVISSSKEKGTSTLINFPLEYQIVQINEDTMKKSD